LPNENQLYEQWRSAPVADRKPLEDQLYSKVRKHAAAIVVRSLPDADPQLARDIAADVLRQLETFRRESEFSTWVHSFAINKIKQEIRRRVRYRRVIDDTIAIEDVDAKKRWRGNQNSTTSIDLERLRQGLTRDESILFDLKREGLTDREIARKLKRSQDAIESSWCRLKRKLRQKSAHHPTEK
jgi:RNA polymerase sigma-70 factor (ECF subfamily)